jgi:dihydrodipicolinate synthase/N-acetylneuraminate lyase
MLLSGIFPPITTPFYPDGSLYLKKLEANVAQYSKAPLAGLVALGSTGEAVMLSDDETRQVLRTVAESAEPDKVLIAGCGRESARETLALCRFAADCGYDVAMVRTPHYFKSQLKPENVLAFYRTVADESPLPVIIYNFPQCTGYDMPVEIVAELGLHPNLIGIKESCGDVGKVKRLVEATRAVRRTANVTDMMSAVTGRMLKPAPSPDAAAQMISAAALTGGTQSASTAVLAPPAQPSFKTRTKEVGFQVMVGSAQTLKESLDVGAVGAILAFADAAPTACFEIYTTWKDGDMKLAAEKQQRIAGAAKRLVGELSIPAIKYAMELNGYYGGPVRLPLLPPTAEVKHEVETLMADVR